MTDYIYRADMTGLNAAGAATVFRYATRGYQTTPSHATLANTAFQGRLKQPLLLRRDFYGEGRTYGEMQIPHGEAVLTNSDGALDTLRDYGFDGQLFELWRIDPATPDTEVLVHRGQLESVSMDIGLVRLLVRDATYALDRALQPTKYAGNNSLPNGLEGTADDIGGTPKPILIGELLNVSPPLVNTSRYIYQLHDAALGTGYGINQVYDKRVALNAGILRTLTEMQNGATSYTVSSIDTATDVITFTASHSITNGDPVHVAATTTVPGGLVDTQYYYARSTAADKCTLHPTAGDATANTNIVDITSAGAGTITVAENRTPYGRYDRCSDSAGSYIRLGSKPEGQVTCDVHNPPSTGITGSFTDWSDIVKALLARGGTYTLDNDITISTDSSEAAGVYIREETTIYQAIQQVLQTCNGSLQIYPNRASATVYATLQRLELPGASAAVDIIEKRVLGIELVAPQDISADDNTDDRGIPVWRVNEHYGRNWTVQNPNDVAGASLSTIAFVGREWRVAQTEDSAVKSRFPFAGEMSVFSARVLASSAQRAYLDSIYFELADLLKVTVSLSLFEDVVTSGPPDIPGPMLGMTVQLTHPRFGLAAGKMMTILGYMLDYEARECELLLWRVRP